MKLGGGRANFKNTPLERPSVKSSSTSVFGLFPKKVKQVSIYFVHVNLLLDLIQLPNILGFAKNSLMGFKFGF